MIFREVATIVIVAFVLLSIIITAVGRIDNMKWDETVKYIERENEKSEQEKRDKLN